MFVCYKKRKSFVLTDCWEIQLQSRFPPVPSIQRDESGAVQAIMHVKQGGKGVFRDAWWDHYQRDAWWGRNLPREPGLIGRSSVMRDLLFSQRVTRDFPLKFPWWFCNRDIKDRQLYQLLALFPHSSTPDLLRSNDNRILVNVVNISFHRRDAWFLKKIGMMRDRFPHPPHLLASFTRMKNLETRLKRLSLWYWTTFSYGLLLRRFLWNLSSINKFILLYGKFLQFDWLRTVVFQLHFEIPTCENYKPFAGSSINK